MPEERAILGPVEPWIRGIALVIWLFVGVSRFHQIEAWIVPWLAYGVLMIVAGFRARFSKPVNVTVLAAQSLSVLALPRLGLVGFEGMLLSFVIIQLPAVVSMRTSIAWVVAHLVVLWPDVWPFNNLTQMLEMTGAYAAFSTFGLLVHQVRMQERRARAELARSNASLLTTRALVVENSRQAERLRISRELHDSLGHHLAALKVNLELAERQVQGKPAEAVSRAKEISQAALGEVRKVVAEMQTQQGVELVAALKALASGFPSPRIEIHAPDDLDAGGGELSHALFRCTQEAITNAVKHASAKSITVDVKREEGKLRIVVRDDGVGTKELKPGNGLTGMRARVAALGGDVHFDSPPGGGFQVTIAVPT